MTKTVEMMRVVPLASRKEALLSNSVRSVSEVIKVIASGLLVEPSVLSVVKSGSVDGWMVVVVHVDVVVVVVDVVVVDCVVVVETKEKSVLTTHSGI